MNKPLVLIILDGFGLSRNEKFNAIKLAKTLNLDKLFSNNPFVEIGASGLDVGLPDGQMGNSEVGHTNIGAGRVVYQDLTRITKSIEDGDFYKNSALNSAIDNAIKNNTSLHLMGLLSNGGVHSHNSHLYALLKLAKSRSLTKVYIHAILDGRDTPPSSADQFILDCEEQIEKIGTGKISTITGRYFAMDRDNRWDRVEKAYRAFVNREGNKAENAVSAIRESYKSGVGDEFVEPTIISGTEGIKKNDSIIFFNFRPDRAREITRALVDPNFDKFSVEKSLFDKDPQSDSLNKSNINYVCLTQYDATMPNVSVAFPPDSLDNTFGEYISKLKLKQLRIAETEKYAHVTFFFNGGVEKVYEGEERILVPSPHVATYDLQPEMSAYEVTKKAKERIKSKELDVIVLNFANCDMVGHTGNLNATIKAVETIDACVNELIEATLEIGGCAIITADHGNADKLCEEDGSPFTAHTSNPVPFCVVGYPCRLRDGGKLSDIAPTMLKILNLDQPKEMTGESIII